MVEITRGNNLQIHVQIDDILRGKQQQLQARRRDEDVPFKW